MASEPRPNPMRIDLIPRISSNAEMIGILPPDLTGTGILPYTSLYAFSAALYASRVMGHT